MLAGRIVDPRTQKTIATLKSRIIILLIFFPPVVFSQNTPADQSVRLGNTYYKEGKFAKAEEEYSKAAAADPTGFTAKFNQANALFKQDKQMEAASLFAGLAAGSKDPGEKAKAFYNKAVVLTRQHNLEESIEAYKNALRNDPEDKEARENLQKALLERKKKSPEKKEDKKPKKEEPQKQDPSRMNPREAEQRLKLLQQKEKEVQQRVQKEKNQAGGSLSKDW